MDITTDPYGKFNMFQHGNPKIRFGQCFYSLNTTILGGLSYKIGWCMSFSTKRSGMMPVAAHARNSSGSFPRLSEKDSFKEMLDGGVIGIFVLP